MAMFGGAVFLGQYFQIGRGYSPTEAGLLTIPLMGGVLIASIVAGRLITKTGRIKPYIVAGSIVLVAGFVGLGFIDHDTPLAFIDVAMFAVGVGVGMTMQNLVLAVQNTVDVREIGASSATVAFFRSLGGAVGVSVLGAVLAARVKDQIIQGLLAGPGGAEAARKLQEGGSGGTSLLDVNHLPPQLAELVRQSYGDATGRIFLIAAACALVSLVAVFFIKEVPLRRTVAKVDEIEDLVDSSVHD